MFLRHLYYAVCVAAALCAASLHADTYTLDETFGQVPLVFTPNEGQFDAPVKFAVEGNNLNALNDFENIGFIFKDINHAAEITVDDRVSWNNNYFIGNDPVNWHTDVPNYKHVRIHDIYDGIDLTCTSNDRRIDFEILIQPHADPSQIVFGGTDYYNNSFYRKFYFNEQDELVGIRLNTTTDILITEQPPYCFQLINGKEIPVEVMFTITDDGQAVGYEFGEYDPDYELVVRPELVDSELWILKNTMGVSGIDVDDSGNVYVAGNVSFNVLSSLFVLKLNETGDELGYAIYYGVPEGFNHVSDIEIDNFGNAIIAGNFNGDFPTTPNAFDIIKGNYSDSYVLKLNYYGNELLFSTYLGGSKSDSIADISLDNLNNIVVGGSTNSSDFPVKSGSYDTSFDQYIWNGFITKINNDGSDLIYSTFLNGAQITEILVDNLGNVYITGENTGTLEFPTTIGVFNEDYNGNNDAFITKLNSNGSNLIYSTYLGGTEREDVNGIAVDNFGNAYITGYTESSDYPTTNGVYQKNYRGDSYDVFITKINSSGTDLVYSTFLGGRGIDYSQDIVVDDYGNAYLTGSTSSNDFPTTNEVINKNKNNNDDIFFTKLSTSGSELLYSTFLGGESNDGGYGILFDNSGAVYIEGLTRSNDFPVINTIFDVGRYSGNYVKGRYIIKLLLNENTNIDKAYISQDICFINPPYPNPFNNSTTISYYLPRNMYVQLIIYNIQAQKIDTIISDFQVSGKHTINWDAGQYSSGFYFVSIHSENIYKTEKLLLLK